MFKEFKMGNIHKFYLAYVYGILNKKESTLNNYLIKLNDGVKVVENKEKNSVNIITKYIFEFRNIRTKIPKTSKHLQC